MRDELVSFLAGEAVAGPVFVSGEERMPGGLLGTQPVTERQTGHAERPGDLVGGDDLHDAKVDHPGRDLTTVGQARGRGPVLTARAP